MRSFVKIYGVDSMYIFSLATPGRFVDHLKRTKGFDEIKLQNLRFLVIDEADRMLGSDFESVIEKVLIVLPVKRQTFLFSATMTEKVSQAHSPHHSSPPDHCVFYIPSLGRQVATSLPSGPCANLHEKKQISNSRQSSSVCSTGSPGRIGDVSYISPSNCFLSTRCPN